MTPPAVKSKSGISREDEAVLSLLTDQVRDSVLKRGMLPLTEVQERGIPVVLSGRNALLISPTGTGKTEAVLIPIFHLMKVSENKKTGFRVLYITPLKALNRDLLERISWWSTDLDISVGIRHGDSPKAERAQQSMQPPNIIVTTPETFQILLVGRRLSSHLKAVDWVIIDEVHELAEEKRGAQLVLGLERLREIKGSDFQIIGLSATVGDPKLLGSFLVGRDREVSIVEAAPEKWIEIDVSFPRPTQEDYERSRETLEHPTVLARLKYIKEQIEQHDSTLLFTNTRATAESLSNKFMLYETKLPLAIHHGSLGTTTRLMAERGLKGGTLKGVVATSSLELGIDIGQVDFVVQYGSPRQSTHLIQRVGRSGHGVGEVSRGVIVAMDEEDLMESVVLRNRALRKDLEAVDLSSKPFDVLAHQIVGYLLTRGRSHIEDLIDLVSRATIYKDLTLEELGSVLDFLRSKYPSILRYDPPSGIVVRGRGTATYEFYYDHLSTIPEVRQYRVIDSNTKDIVGILDEEFVAEKGIQGTKFIMAGRVWVIEAIEEGDVRVMPSDDPTGAVPFWAGEEIPVKFAAARELGTLRREITEMLSRGMSGAEIAEDLGDRMHLEPRLMEEMLSNMRDSVAEKYPVATDKSVVMECWGEKLIFHACNGDQVNSALAKIVGSLLSERDHMVSTSRDPYRIIVDQHVDPGVLLSKLKSLEASQTEELLLSGIESVGMFKRRIIHVGRRFGVIERQADLTSVQVDKLASMLKGTPVFEEAKKELMQKDYDAEKLKVFLSELRSGSLTVEVIEGRELPSPLSRAALRRTETHVDLFPPDRVDKILLRYALARLRSGILTLICTENLDYFETLRVADMTFPLKCPSCGSGYVGVVPDEDAARSVKYRPKSRKSQRVLERARRTALLLYRHRERAAMALVARRVPLKDIESILESSKADEEFTKAVVDAERRLSFRSY